MGETVSISTAPPTANVVEAEIILRPAADIRRAVASIVVPAGTIAARRKLRWTIANSLTATNTVATANPVSSADAITPANTVASTDAVTAADTIATAHAVTTANAIAASDAITATNSITTATGPV
jgi:hypothetical protein